MILCYWKTFSVPNSRVGKELGPIENRKTVPLAKQGKTTRRTNNVKQSWAHCKGKAQRKVHSGWYRSNGCYPCITWDSRAFLLLVLMPQKIYWNLYHKKGFELAMTTKPRKPSKWSTCASFPVRTPICHIVPVARACTLRPQMFLPSGKKNHNLTANLCCLYKLLFKGLCAFWLHLLEDSRITTPGSQPVFSSHTVTVGAASTTEINQICPSQYCNKF